MDVFFASGVVAVSGDRLQLVLDVGHQFRMGEEILFSVLVYLDYLEVAAVHFLD